MTTDRRRARGMFVPLQANYFMDPAILAVGNGGELAYLRSLALAKLCDNDGHLMCTQCAPVRRGIRRWERTSAALVEHNLWIPSDDGSGFRIRSWSQHNETKVEREAANAQDAARMRTSRARAKEKTVIDVFDRTPRVERREEKREKSETRPPSGSGRVSLPAAAQRGTEGAAQHPAAAAVRLELQRTAGQRRAKLNKPPTADKDRREHVDFSATLAKLTEAAERLNPSDPEVEQ